MEESIATAVKPRLGFLGVGWIGQNRLKAVYQSGHSTVASVCDFSADMAQQAAEIAGNCSRTESYEELLQSNTEGIVIATPSAHHASQTEAALQQGKAVFVQKPLALDAHTTRHLVALAEEKDCLLHVDFSYRHTRAMQAVKEVIDSGKIGEVYAADLKFHNAYGPDKSWYYNAREAGGGCLTDLGIHLVDTLYWLFPEAELRQSHSGLYKGGKALRSPQSEVEDYAAAQLKLSTGLQANIACSWNLPAGKEAEIEATFYGTEGGVKFENLQGSFYDFKASLLKGTESHSLETPPDDWGGRTAVKWAEKLAVDGNSFDPACRQYIKVAETLDKLYNRTGHE